MLFKKHWFLRSILKYSSPVLSLVEKPRIRQYGAQDPDFPCVFIVGPPRTGSTILYQLITRMLDVAYVDNLANLARYNPYFGMSLSRKFFGDVPHASFSSNFGQTGHEGLRAPAEPLFFYKWFPRDRHYTTPEDLDAGQLEDFRRTVIALVNLSQKPLVIKNLSFSLRLQVLREVFPSARYIVVTRDPLYTAQSILVAMRKNNVPPNRVWGILPREFREIEDLDPFEKVVLQVYYIEKQVARDLKPVPGKNKLYLDYEGLGADTYGSMERIRKFMGAETRMRSNISPPGIALRNTPKLQVEEMDRIRMHIEKLDWAQK